MKKISLISVRGRSEWMSCNFIRDNIRASYDQLGRKYQVRSFEIDEEYSLSNWNQFLKDIKSFSPDFIIIIDHGKSLIKILKYLIVPEANLLRVPLVIHCYGDFLHHSKFWLKNQGALRGWPIRFLAASQASSEIIQKNLNQPEKFVEIIPFAVDTNIFSHFQSENSNRSHLKFIYSGRLSLQKNIHLMLPLLSEWSKSRQQNVELTLVGPFDDIGVDILGMENKPLGYFQQIQKMVHEMENSKFKVKIKSAVDHRSLMFELNSSDLFVSLSLHHDEDFGMAPAEALCCGLPCVLSSWGGYRSFGSMAETSGVASAVKLVPLTFSLDRMSFSKNSFFEALDSSLNSNKSRIQVSQAFSNILSVETVARKIDKILSTSFFPFQGFSKRLSALNAFYYRSAHGKNIQFSDPEYSDFYQPYFI